MVQLHQGGVALDVAAPATGAKGLTGGASLNLDASDVSMKLKASASAGADAAASNVWGRQDAEFEASWSGLGTVVTASGTSGSGLSYRAPASIGDPGSATHVIRTDDRSVKLSSSFSPLSKVQVEIGAQGASSGTEDTSRPAALDRTAIRSDAQSVFATADWHPTGWLGVQAGATANSRGIAWRAADARATRYTSVDPHLDVTVTPWEGTAVKAGVEHWVAPYDTAAFISGAGQTGGGLRFEPDHSWRVHAQMQQAVGPASLTADYSAERSGTVTEFAVTPSGGQAPASTPLAGRAQVALALSMPLNGLGLGNTTVISRALWQDSRVRDPVTSALRRASGETPQAVSFRLVHDLPLNKVSLGLTGALTDSTTRYQVNEASTEVGGGTLGAFLAYKPGPYEMDMSLSGLGAPATRDTYYSGSRADSSVARTTEQDGTGPTVSISLHKAF